MSEATHHEDDEKDEVYKPPKEVALQEILTMDQEDQALNKYKQQVCRLLLKNRLICFVVLIFF